MRETVERADTRERVRCATGSCVSSAMFKGTSLGGVAVVTLGGGMATLGGGSSTLVVGTCRVGG